MDNIDKYIQDGLDAIDEEIKTDEDIREISRLIKDELIRNSAKGLETRITDLNGNWKLEYYIYKYLDIPYVKLLCYNETRMIMAQNYRPLILDAEIDDEFGAEEALEAAITMFVAKQFNRIIVEELKDND